MLSANSFVNIILWCLIAAGILLCLYFAFHLLIWLIMIITGLFVSMKKTYDKPSKFYCTIFNIGYWSLYTLARVKPHVTGLEKVPFDRHFMFVSNHRSKFDNMVHSVALKKTQLAFVSKPENFKIPIGRRMMQRCCYIPIQRNNPREGLKAILRSISLIQKDYVSIGVFPEGTRSKTNELLDFKPGCFKIAEKTKCPIVVGVTQGTEKIHKNFPWKKSDVYFDIINVLYPQDYEGKSTIEIADYIKQLIQNHITEANL